MKLLTTLAALLVSLPAVQGATESPNAALVALKKVMPACSVSRKLLASDCSLTENYQLECMVEYIPKSTCSFTDTKCICTNAALNEEIGLCVAGGCTIPDALSEYGKTVPHLPRN